MKYDLLAFHAWFGERWGWWSAVPITIFWVVLWPVGIIWAVISLVAYYVSLDKSPEAVAKRRTTRAKSTPTPSKDSDSVPFYLLCWMFCWFPLVGQGLVPIIATLAGGAAFPGFFIAFYFPEALQWPFMLTMTVLGAVLLGIAIGGTNWRALHAKVRK